MKQGKPFFILAILFLFGLQTNSIAMNVDLGVQVPAYLGLSFAGNAGIWPGMIFGGGLTAKIGFLENLIMPNSKFAFEAFGLFSWDDYFLPSYLYAEGSFISSFNIRYGGNVVFYFAKNWYAGLGATLVYSFAGSYGTPTLNTNFTTNMLGNDIYLSVIGGYEFEILKDRLFLPVEAKLSFGLTIPNALVMEFGVNVSCVYRFHIIFSTNITVHQTQPPVQPPVKEPMKKLSEGEIQKLGVPEIASLARKAMAENEIDYAKLLVKEGLLKEPDNSELLALFNDLMKK